MVHCVFLCAAYLLYSQHIMVQSTAPYQITKILLFLTAVIDPGLNAPSCHRLEIALKSYTQSQAIPTSSFHILQGVTNLEDRNTAWGNPS